MPDALMVKFLRRLLVVQGQWWVADVVAEFAHPSITWLDDRERAAMRRLLRVAQEELAAAMDDVDVRGEGEGG